MQTNIKKDFGFLIRSINIGTSSILLFILTQNHGLVFIKAKGLRLKHPVGLLPAKIYNISWQTYRGEYNFLKEFCISYDYCALKDRFAQAMQYLNNLIWKLRDGFDDTCIIFGYYTKVVIALSHSNQIASRVAIRKFEWMLIATLGYNFNLDLDINNNKIDTKCLYILDLSKGFIKDHGQYPLWSKRFPGQVIMDIKKGNFMKDMVNSASKIIFQLVLKTHIKLG